MRLWPRFTRTPAEIFRNWRDMAAGFLILALIYDLTHGPCYCGRVTCPYCSKKVMKERKLDG